MARFRLVQENFFTSDECKGFIDLAEKEGFKGATIHSKEGEIVNKDYRDNDRVIWDNKQVAEQLFKLIKDLVPYDIGGYEPVGVNEKFRFYRYKEGQQFKPHVDGSFVRNEKELSLLTVLIYLNEGFEGGSTFLITLNENVIPKTGMLLIFDHKMLHSGAPVSAGTKYVLRTDVMYRLKKYENDPAALNETNIIPMGEKQNEN